MKSCYFWGVLLLVGLTASGCGLLVDEGRQVIARVGKEPIRLDELLVRIRALPFEERARTNDPDQSVRLQVRRSLLENIVVEELLMQEAQARGIEVTDEEVNAALAQNEQAEAPENPELSEGMGGSSGHEHKHDKEEHSKSEITEMRLQLMVQKMLNAELSEATRKRYYEGHREEFALSPPQMVYELLVMDRTQGGVIERISERAASGPMTLMEALSSFPDPPKVVFCGELPPAPPQRIVPAIREKIERLSVGQVSEPFLLNTGAEEQLAAARLVRHVDTIPYERVREVIHKKLYDNLLKGLEQKYEVVYYPDKLDYRLER